MADKNKMSVEEILAACRAADSPGGSSSDSTASATTETKEEPTAESPTPKEGNGDQVAPGKPPAAAPPAGKKPQEMSAEEVLAAARAAAGGGSPSKAETSEKKEAAPAGEKKPAGKMSTADILAAARGEKGGKKSPAAEKAAPKPAAKPAAKPKAAPAAKAEKPQPSGPKDTASILAAARGGDKPGPVSKSQAKASPAKKTRPVPPMPEKPDYARRPEPSRASDSESRRGFLLGALVGSSLAIGFTTLATTHLLWLLGLARFMFPNVLIEPPTKFKVGFPDDFAPGQVETKFKPGFGVWIARAEYEGQPQIYALKSVCTHLGCTPNWLEGEQKFKCPCHGSGFYKDGVNFEGPAPRPLERYAISIADDGQIEVDKSKTFQQELGQWSDSESFVPV